MLSDLVKYVTLNHEGLPTFRLEWTEIPFRLGVVCAGEGRGGPVLGPPTGEQAEAALAEDRLQELGGRG